VNAGPLHAAVARAAPLAPRGRLTRITGLAVEAALGGVRIGEVVEIGSPGRDPLPAEVVGVREDRAVLLPLGELAGLGLEAEVVPTGRRLAIRVGEALRGRVLDGLGRPIDGRPPPQGLAEWPVSRPPPPPLARRRISTPLPLGVRAIDALATVGEGQRLGIFAGAGVGKSTLLGQIARSARADLAVVALVGERGREVREFVEDCLGPEGLARSVVVAATSDEPALVRREAAHVATAIAEWFAEHGARVLLVLDSLTRYARAEREVGLAAGELPARQGYPASVFAALPRLVERAGNRAAGAITALYTVLVAGDDLDEPIADEVRGLLDGHLVLDRRLAEAGRFPALDPLASLSRTMPAVTGEEHRAHARRLRSLLAAHDRHRELIAAGAYRRGTDPETDLAVDRGDAIERFLRQAPSEREPFESALARLAEVAA
jgi:type III secretion protein N (ATPase)